MALIPLPSAYAKGKAATFNASEVINWIPRPASGEVGARGPFYLEGRPGTLPFNTGGGLVRGLYVMRGQLYGVLGTTLVQIDAAGNSTLRGTVLGSAPVSMADNGNQLVIVADSASYVWDSGASTFQDITAGNFLPAISVASLNGYGLFAARGGTTWFRSEGLQLLTYNTLHRAEANAASDALKAIKTTAAAAYIFGDETVEVWRDTGSTTFQFERMAGAVMPVGIAGSSAAAVINGAVYWLGSDGIVYKSTGIVPEAISTLAIADAIEAAPRIDDALLAGFTLAGQHFVTLSLPSAGRSFVFEAIGGTWTEWKTGVSLFPGQFTARAYGKTFVAGPLSGTIYELKTGTLHDAGAEIIRTLRFSLAPGVGEFTIDRLELLFESGISAVKSDVGVIDADILPIIDADGSVLVDAGGPSAEANDQTPTVFLRSSTDGGRTWGDDIPLKTGHQGEYVERCIANNLGKFTTFAVFEVSVSAKAPWRLIAADAIMNGRGV